MRYLILIASLAPAALAFADPDKSTTQPRAAHQPIATDNAVAIATAFADSLVAGNYDAAVSPFNRRMKSAIDADKLKELWTGLAKQFGMFDRFSDPRTEVDGESVRVMLPANWKNTSLDMHVLISRSGKITGLWFRPPAAATNTKLPDYVRPDRFTERDITIGRDPWKLKGKISIPNEKSKKPAVVLVHGSGPHDMNETIGPNTPFRDLAGGLASNGIVVLRYDKRSYTHGMKMKPDKVNARAEVIDDALAAIAFLREQPGVDPSQIFLIGHSLGGCLGPAIIAEEPKLAGFISLAGTQRSLYDLVADQLTYLASLPDVDPEKKKQMLAEVEKIRGRATSRPATVLGAPVAYWDDIDSYLGDNGFEAARDFSGRILILGGGRDHQITRKDFDLWQSALKDRPNTTFHWVPTVNHLFAEGVGMSTDKEYEKLQSVSSRVIDGLAQWIKTGTYPPEPASTAR